MPSTRSHVAGRDRGAGVRGGVLAEVSQLLGEGRAGAGQRQQVQHQGGGARHRAVQVHVSTVQVQYNGEWRMRN